MTLAFGSTKCSQCLCSTGLGIFLKFLLKKTKNCQFQTWGTNCSWSKNRTPLKCGMFWSVALTPYISLPAKRYKEAASIKELLANLFNKQKMGYSLGICICVLLCRRGPYVGITVSDPINTLHSLKHKKSSSRRHT